MPTSNQNKPSLAELLRAAQDRSGQTQREVADLINMDESNLSRILTGSRKVANRDILICLCLSGWCLDCEETNRILEAAHYPRLALPKKR
jgi:transcriptional regulator with XRE-family HTH domain